MVRLRRRLEDERYRLVLFMAPYVRGFVGLSSYLDLLSRSASPVKGSVGRLHRRCNLFGIFGTAGGALADRIGGYRLLVGLAGVGLLHDRESLRFRRLDFALAFLAVGVWACRVRATAQCLNLSRSDFQIRWASSRASWASWGFGGFFPLAWNVIYRHGSFWNRFRSARARCNGMVALILLRKPGVGPGPKRRRCAGLLTKPVSDDGARFDITGWASIRQRRDAADGDGIARTARFNAMHAPIAGVPDRR